MSTTRPIKRYLLDSKDISRLLIPTIVLAAALSAQDTADLAGEWHGLLETGPVSLRLVLEIQDSSDGTYSGTLVSVDQGNTRLPIDAIDLKGDRVSFDVRAVKGSFSGTLDSNNKTISGTWTQGKSLPLEFTKAP